MNVRRHCFSYDVMMQCWNADPDDRIEFSDVRMQLATQLEDITEDYSYLKLDAAKDYYNVQYGDEKVGIEILFREIVFKNSFLTQKYNIWSRHDRNYLPILQKMFWVALKLKIFLTLFSILIQQICNVLYL